MILKFVGIQRSLCLTTFIMLKLKAVINEITHNSQSIPNLKVISTMN
jgi:hypothetical protein